MALTPQERSRIAQQDSYYLLMPLELGPSPLSIAAHTRKMARLLRDKQSPSPCGEVVQHLARLYDRSAPTTPAIVCKKGCGHCCSQPVSVTALEACHVAAPLQGRPATAAAVTEAAARIAALSPALRWRDWPRCPMLVDESCSVYAARPLGCHAFVSMRLEACLAAFQAREEPHIPMPRNHVDMLQACRVALYAAMRLVGLRECSYEMAPAIEVILRTPDAEARWLKGEDLLAGLEDPTPIPPAVEVEIANLAGFVAPTL
jgi:Fe-S-cluster containining protein